MYMYIHVCIYIHKVENSKNVLSEIPYFQSPMINYIPQLILLSIRISFALYH